MRTLIPHPFSRSAASVFAKAFFLCEPAPAPSLSLFSLSQFPLHKPNTTALKCENLKTKAPQPPLSHVARHPTLREHKRKKGEKKKKKQHLNNRQVLSTKAFLWCYKASAALFTLHDSTFLLRESQRKIKEGDCFKSEHILLLTVLFMWLC